MLSFSNMYKEFLFIKPKVFIHLTLKKNIQQNIVQCWFYETALKFCA